MQILYSPKWVFVNGFQGQLSWIFENHPQTKIY